MLSWRIVASTRVLHIETGLLDARDAAHGRHASSGTPLSRADRHYLKAHKVRYTHVRYYICKVPYMCIYGFQ